MAARRTRSLWPLVIGSKVPGYSARRFMPAATPLVYLCSHEQMILDLAGLLGFRGRPGWWQGREAGPRWAFDIDERAGAQPPPVFQPVGRQGQKIGVERRIEEHDVEGATGATEKAQRVPVLDLRAARRPLG